MAFRDLEIQERATRNKVLAAELDRRFKGVAHSIDRQDLASILDVSYSYLSEILNTNGEQKRFKTHHIPALVLENPDLFMSEVVGFLCEAAGYNPPEKKRTLTPEEELARLMKKIRERGLEPLFTDIM
ncbi:MAG: hypothetical protein P1S46_06215 [bacterium]|nr:hypothetical protein [bacterium]